jgi:hypothetical protein
VDVLAVKVGGEAVGVGVSFRMAVLGIRVAVRMWGRCCMQGMKLVVRGAAVDVLDDTGGVMVVIVGGLAGVTEALVYGLLGVVPSLMAVLVGGVQQGEV